MIHSQVPDISIINLLHIYPEILNVLLADHTTGNNIFWATSDYAPNGLGFGYYDEIDPDKITGIYSHLIIPRVLKEKRFREARIRDRAEVFTPSWICNTQINLIDTEWFGRKDVFNRELEENGTHSWSVNSAKVAFTEDKTWESYVKSVRLEISCGEAPYLVSRYDTTTGDFIPVENRIGIIDRKLRIVGENTLSTEEWKDWALAAYKSTYGYEWQGDNLLIARETMLLTYVDFYSYMFHSMPLPDDLKAVADVISWNLWQMDGLKGVVPNSCHDIIPVGNLFCFEESESEHCPGCSKSSLYEHNGRYCMIMDWDKGEQIQYVSLVRR